MASPPHLKKEKGGPRKRLISALIPKFQYNYSFKGNAEDAFLQTYNAEHFTGLHFSFESRSNSIELRTVFDCFVELLR